MGKRGRKPASDFGKPPSSASTHSKLTKERRLMLVEGIRAGLTKELAAQRARISVTTLHNWLAEARIQRDSKWKAWPWEPSQDGKGDWAPGPMKKHSREVELLESIEKADSDRIIEALLGIRAAGRGGETVATEETTVTAPDGTVTRSRKTRVTQPDWKAHAWTAERTRPRDYGGIQRTEVSGPEGAPVEVRSLLDLINVAAAQQEEDDKAASQAAQTAQKKPRKGN